MSTVGRYLEYHGGCSVPWGYHDACGGYHEYRGVFSTMGGYYPLKFEYCGGYHDARGRYHEYHGGCSVPWGTQITKDFPPTVLNTLHGTHDIPHVHHDIPPQYSR